MMPQVIHADKYYLVNVDADSRIGGWLGPFDDEDQAAKKAFGKFKVYTGESFLKIRKRDPLYRQLDQS